MTSAQGSPRASVHPVCPRCGKALRRLRRRAIDRWISKVMPVHRYKYSGPRCGREGNLRRPDPGPG